MNRWIFLALLGLGAWVWLGGWGQVGKWGGDSGETAPVYRWKDERGKLVYGSVPPAGLKAERVHAEGRMSVVDAPPAKPVVQAKKATEQVGDLKEKMIERAIEGTP